MPELKTSPSLVRVILDLEFGEHLHDVWPGSPVWIAMSPVNAPIVRSIRAAHPEPNHLVGITGFNFDANASGEDTFLGLIDTIDLHHGWLSSASPYTELSIVGARLTADIHDALSELGFTQFYEEPDGFSAGRSVESAARPPE